MDGVSEDFSGLPEYKTRGERRTERLDRGWSDRRNNPYRGHRTKVLVVGGFVLTLLLIAVSLVMLFAPTPYLGMSHGALAQSVGDPTGRGCHPSGDAWICTKNAGGSDVRYRVRVDWAGCWSGSLIGSPEAPRNISGCVSIMDHIKAG